MGSVKTGETQIPYTHLCLSDFYRKGVNASVLKRGELISRHLKATMGDYGFPFKYVPEELLVLMAPDVEVLSGPAPQA